VHESEDSADENEDASEVAANETDDYQADSPPEVVAVPCSYGGYDAEYEGYEVSPEGSDGLQRGG